MADIKTVSVRLTALNDQFKSSMKESGDATKAFGQVSTVALAAAGVAAVAFAKHAVDAYQDYGKSIMGLSRVSGENIETSSRFAFAAQQSGISVTQLSGGIKFLEKNMAANNATFGELGVETRNAAGGLRGAHDVFLDTANAISKMSNGAEKTAVILSVFGRSGLDMGKLLNKGADGIRALEAEATKYGVVLSKDNVADISANMAAHRKLDATMTGLQITVGSKLLPVMTSVTEVFGKVAMASLDNIGPIVAVGGAFLGVAVVIPKVISGFQALMASGALMNVAMGGIAAGGMFLVMKSMNDVNDATVEFEKTLSGAIDWTSFGTGAAGLNKEGEAVNKLGAEWDRMNTAEQVANYQKGAMYDRARAQYEQDLARYTEQSNRIRNLGQEMGVTGAAAQAMSDSMHVDLTKIDPAVYTPIFKGLADGSITAAQAELQLAGAAQTVAETAEEATKRIDEERKAIKAKNDYERGLFDPQFAVVNAQSGVKEANDKASGAGYDVMLKQAQLEQARRSYPKGGIVVDAAAAALEQAKANQVKASQDVVTANLELDSSTRNLTQSFKENGKSLEEANGVLDAWVTNGTMTKDTADKVREAFEKATVAVWAYKDALDPSSSAPKSAWSPPGADAWSKGAGGGQAPAAPAPQWGYNPYADPKSPLFGQKPPSMHASGGYLAEGYNIINEEGSELMFKDGASVSVETAGRTSRILTPHPSHLSGQSGGASSPAGFVHNGDIIIGTATSRTPADIIYEQRKRAVLAGGGMP